MTIKDIVLTAIFAALIAVLGFLPALPVSFIPVPLTFQTLGVMLAGSILGAKRGVASILIIYIFVAAGMPLLAVGRGGLSQFFSPTSGYLYGWIVGVFIIGLGYDYVRNKTLRSKPVFEIIFLILGGIIAIHFCGILWLTINGYMTLNKALLMDLVFIPGDLVKVALTFFITRALQKALPEKF